MSMRLSNILLSLCGLALGATSVLADVRAPTVIEQETAMGHYSRARALLIEAVREFDRGAKVVSPERLLDTAAFRGSIIERADELQHVIDPQPRLTESGVRFQSDPRLMGSDIRVKQDKKK